MAHVSLEIRRPVVLPSHSALKCVARGFCESGLENVVILELKWCGIGRKLQRVLA